MPNLLTFLTDFSHSWTIITTSNTAITLLTFLTLLAVFRFSPFSTSAPNIVDFRPKVPRCLCEDKEVVSKEIVTFVDASLKAYGAVVYLICTYDDGYRTSRLITSKSKVAPLTPRLELTAAILGLRQTQNVLRALEMNMQNVPTAQMSYGGFVGSVGTSDRSWPTVRGQPYRRDTNV